MASGPARDSADVELELAGSWRSASPGPRANGLDDGEDGEERAFVADEEDSADGRTVDELFDERIGQANRTQLAQFALSSFAWFPAAFLTLTSVFTARVPDWVCAVEGTCSHAETGLPLEICDMDRELWKWVDPKSSIVSEWDLVCSHEYKVQLADSIFFVGFLAGCLLYTSPSPRDKRQSRMPSSA